MKDESPTLNRIIADCVQAQYRYLPDPADIDPHDVGRRVVMYRLQLAENDVVSR
jgi:hypothetical protein